MLNSSTVQDTSQKNKVVERKKKRLSTEQKHRQVHAIMALVEPLFGPIWPPSPQDADLKRRLLLAWISYWIIIFTWENYVYNGNIQSSLRCFLISKGLELIQFLWDQIKSQRNIRKTI